MNFHFLSTTSILLICILSFSYAKIVLPHKLRYLESMLDSEAKARSARMRQRMENAGLTYEDEAWGGQYSQQLGYPAAYQAAYPNAYQATYPNAYQATYPNGYQAAYPTGYKGAYPPGPNEIYDAQKAYGYPNGFKSF